VEARVARAAGGRVLRACGRTPDLLALVGVLARADLLLTNDTGPMHLAAALGTPVLALFGATDPVVSGPAGPGPRVLVHDPEPCSPCFLRDCPIPGHPCLAKIGSARVLREAVQLLDGAPRADGPGTRPG
jgi:ADP-heptose:LPS heptosyltransferase